MTTPGAPSASSMTSCSILGASSMAAGWVSGCSSRIRSLTVHSSTISRAHRTPSSPRTRSASRAVGHTRASSRTSLPRRDPDVTRRVMSSSGFACHAVTSSENAARKRSVSENRLLLHNSQYSPRADRMCAAKRLMRRRRRSAASLPGSPDRIQLSIASVGSSVRKLPPPEASSRPSKAMSGTTASAALPTDPILSGCVSQFACGRQGMTPVRNDHGRTLHSTPASHGESRIEVGGWMIWRIIYGFIVTNDK